MNDGAAPLELSPPVTTRELQALLADRYPGDRYSLFFDVPDDVGMHARRRADAIAVGTWKSVGHYIDGFELKASRSDWLRELKAVEKADPFIERCDRWWLVTSSPAIAKLEEIPACWGWLAATKGGLRVQRPAQLLRPKNDTVPRLFMIGILRKFRDDLLNAPEVRLVLEANAKSREEEIQKRVEERTRFTESQRDRGLERIASFEKDTGFRLDDWNARRFLKLAMAFAKIGHHEGLDAVAHSFERQQSSLEHLLECVKLARAELGPLLEPPPAKENT